MFLVLRRFDHCVSSHSPQNFSLNLILNAWLLCREKFVVFKVKQCMKIYFVNCVDCSLQIQNFWIYLCIFNSNCLNFYFNEFETFRHPNFVNSFNNFILIDRLEGNWSLIVWFFANCAVVIISFLDFFLSTTLEQEFLYRHFMTSV